MALQAILFDYGNTLVSTRLDWRRVLPANLEGLNRALELHFPRLDFERLDRDFLFLRSAGKRRAERELIETPAVESLQKALELQGYREISEDTLQAGVDGFFKAEEGAYSIIFGVPETLSKLRAMGLKLAVVSNATCGRLVRRALERRGLMGYIQHVAVSADLGPCKPDPSIFWGSMHALETRAEECAVVGDRPEIDIEGARRAGMRAVLADFFGDAADISTGGPRPDAVVRHPQELVDLFKKWLVSASLFP
jgi:HAD superfamily hydrolase (TIGR01509 family)